MATERPVRIMDLCAEEFWEFTGYQEFRLQRCSECGAVRWPPAAICDRCLSEQYTWEPASGEAKVISWVTYHRQYFPEYPPPHQVVVVELAEGPIFVGNPVEMDGHQLYEGMPMTLAWTDAHDRFGEYNLPVFKPAD